MKLSGIIYSLKQSLASIFRNGIMSIASIPVLASCLMLLGTFYLFTVNVDANLDDMSSLNEVVVYVDETCNDEEIAAIKTVLSELECDGEKVVVEEYISKEQALESEKAKFEDYPDLFESLKDGDNPYRASFVLTYNDKTDVDNLTNELYNVKITRVTTLEEGTATEEITPIDKVVSHSDVAHTLENLRQAVSGALLIFMAVLFVVGIFIIINTVRLTVSMRSKEISVMRYVGARGMYVTLPFVFEGAIMGAVATVLAFILQWIIYGNICRAIVSDYELIQILPFSDFALMMLLAFAAIGIIAGIIGSLISVAIYIKEE
jgi:cell division transport system permease protein